MTCFKKFSIIVAIIIMMLSPVTAGLNATGMKNTALLHHSGLSPDQQKHFISQKSGDGRYLFINKYLFDPLEESPVMPATLSAFAYPDKSPSFHIVQFDGPIVEAWIMNLRAAGAELLGYLPNNSFIIRTDGGSMQGILSVPHVRWCGDYHPAYKIDPLFQEQLDALGRSGERIQCYASTFRGERMADLQKTIEALSPSLEIKYLKDQSNGRGRMIFTIPADELEETVFKLARIPGIQWIDLQKDLVKHNDDAIWLHQSGDKDTEATPVFDHGITGIGQIYASADDGIDTDSCQMRYSNNPSDQTFYNDTQPPAVNITNPQNKIISYYLYETATAYGPNHPHGQATNGCGAGDDFANLASPSDPGRDKGDGMAPGAQIVFLDIGAGGQLVNNPLFDSIRQAYLSGAGVHNNSYGYAEAWGYDNGSLDCDEAMWALRDITVFFSAGNEGPGPRTIGGIGSTSKNTLAVGACSHPNMDFENMMAFSSHGPTADFRIKPDLVCNGSFQTKTADGNAQSDPPDNTCVWATAGGTSMSSPTAAGLGLLARQYFTDGYYPSGAPVGADAFDPSNALVKGCMVISCRNMTGAFTAINGNGRNKAPRPTYGQGWGRVTLDDALYFPGDHKQLLVLADILNGEDTVDPDRPGGYPAMMTGATHTYALQVTNSQGTEPLMIVLNWSDPAGEKGYNPVLVNNLDLVVTDPTGDIYRGNVNFRHAYSRPAGNLPADNLNPLESVYIENPAAGTYTVEVAGTNVPGNGAFVPFPSWYQGYALAATGYFGTESGPLVEFQKAQVTGGRDDDPYMDAGEWVSLWVSLVNTGLTDATGVSATLSVSPESEVPASSVHILNPTQSYNNIAAGADKVQSYQVALLNDGTDFCRKRITFDCTVTANGAPQVTTAFDVKVARNLVEIPLFNFEEGLEGFTLYNQANGSEPGPDPAPSLVSCDLSGGRPTPRFALKFGPRDCEANYGDQLKIIAQTPAITLPLEEEIQSLNFFHRHQTEYGWDWCQVSMEYGAISPQLLAEFQGPVVEGSMTEMVKTSVDLTYMQEVRLEEFYFIFDLITDEMTNTPLGWMVDDISLTVETCDLSAPDWPAPSISAVEPAELPVGKEYVRVAVTGTHFLNGAAVTSDDTGITVHGASFLSENSLSVVLSIDDEASGLISFQVTNPDGQSGTGTNVLLITEQSGVIITGPGPGPDGLTPPHVRGFDNQGTLIITTDFMAYSDFDNYGINVAAADLDGDGVDEIITGPGKGVTMSPHVRGFEPQGALRPGVDFLAYGVNKYGVNITAGDIDHDGIDEIITGPGPGEIFGPNVRGWDVDGSQADLIGSVNFLAYGTKKFGANIATGDADGDGIDEILTGAGPGAVFGPHVRGWNYDGDTLLSINGLSFFAYGTRKWGVNIHAGDVDRDGYSEILTGAGPGAVFGPHVRGWNYDHQGSITSIHTINFFAYGTKKYGVKVSCGDLDGDGYAEFVTAPGPSVAFGPFVRAWNYDASTVTEMFNFMAYSVGGRFGANVAVADGFQY